MFYYQRLSGLLLLVGGLEYFLFVHFIYGIILPIDFHIVQDGWNHQPDWVYLIPYAPCMEYLPTFAQKSPSHVAIYTSTMEYMGIMKLSCESSSFAWPDRPKDTEVKLTYRGDSDDGWG